MKYLSGALEAIAGPILVRAADPAARFAVDFRTRLRHILYGSDTEAQ